MVARASFSPFSLSNQPLLVTSIKSKAKSGGWRKLEILKIVEAAKEREEARSSFACVALAGHVFAQTKTEETMSSLGQFQPHLRALSSRSSLILLQQRSSNEDEFKKPSLVQEFSLASSIGFKRKLELKLKMLLKLSYLNGLNLRSGV